MGYSQWSEVIQFTTPEHQEFDTQWCPKGIRIKSDNKVAEKINNDGYRTVMGTIPNSSFKIKITKWVVETYIGMAPHKRIKLEENNSTTCGWYLFCFKSYNGLGYLFSQQGDNGREYVKEKGTIKEGSVIEGVLTEEIIGGKKNRKISFAIDGRNFGVAFSKIPPEIGDLYPCVIAYDRGETIEFVE